ncbi:MAG: YSC84-related protein [Limisphaerales bacterium]
MMKSTRRFPSLSVVFLALLTLGTSGHSSLAADPEIEKRVLEAQAAVERFKKADSGIAALLDAASGYAVFPKIGKGGLVIGGAHGDGLVYEKSHLAGTASMSQVTVGAQIGGQSFAELILFENAESLAQFKESRFEMAAQVGAVAAAEGVSKNAKYVHGVMVFTLANRGLMAEASIGGQKFKFTPVPPPAPAE